jgi:hypothetical protein
MYSSYTNLYQHTSQPQYGYSYSSGPDQPPPTNPYSLALEDGSAYQIGTVASSSPVTTHHVPPATSSTFAFAFPPQGVSDRPVSPVAPKPSSGSIASILSDRSPSAMSSKLPKKSTTPSSLSSTPTTPYKTHRRRRSTKNQSIDRDSLIIAMCKQGKPLSEVAQATGMESEEAVRSRYEHLCNQRVDWDKDDIECLRSLLEVGERAKWKFISAELSKDRNKRIPPTACQKKFRDMFGVAEASSMLGSSLAYVVFPDGWSCLDSKPISRASLQSVYESP